MAPSLNVQAPQTDTGLRAPLDMVGGSAGGAAKGIDLSPPAQRVLYTQQQRQLGVRAAGMLTATLPSTELPPISAYPKPASGLTSTALQYPGYVPAEADAEQNVTAADATRRVALADGPGHIRSLRSNNTEVARLGDLNCNRNRAPRGAAQ